MDAHDTHCCIDHGCKYSDPGCPVEKGIRKQQCLCELCGLETEGYYGEPKCTANEQQEYIDALWEQKHNPKELTSLEEAVAKIARRYGRSKTLAILQETTDLGLSNSSFISILLKLKEIK